MSLFCFTSKKLFKKSFPLDYNLTLNATPVPKKLVCCVNHRLKTNNECNDLKLQKLIFIPNRTQEHIRF